MEPGLPGDGRVTATACKAGPHTLSTTLCKAVQFYPDGIFQAPEPVKQLP